jgi:RHS repeat-associated protein
MWRPESDLPRFATARSGLRFYSPKLGRWVSRDPIEERGGCSLFVSFRNCPTVYWDSLGLASSLLPTVTYASGTYTVTGAGWSGAIAAAGGSVSLDRSFDLADSFGAPLYLLGDVLVSAKGRVVFTPNPITKGECRTSFSPFDSSGGFTVGFLPPGLSVISNQRWGAAIESRTSVGLYNWGLALEVPVSQRATVSFLVWSEQLCTCFKVAGRLDLDADVFINPFTLPAAYLALVTSPSWGPAAFAYVAAGSAVPQGARAFAAAFGY